MNKATAIIATGLLFGACSWVSAAPILSVSPQGGAAAGQEESRGGAGGAQEVDHERAD